MDEWHTAIDSFDDTTDDENDNGEEDMDDKFQRAAILQPSLDDFTIVLKAWEKESERYSNSHRKNPESQNAIDRVWHLWGILQQLYQDGVDDLKPNTGILEYVLRVLARSRESRRG